MNNEKSFETHTITVNNRRHSDLTGIDDVISFDDNTVTAHSALGDMVIEGEELKIDNFSAEKGILSISGKVNGIFYFDNASKRHTSKKKNVKPRL